MTSFRRFRLDENASSIFWSVSIRSGYAFQAKLHRELWATARLYTPSVSFAAIRTKQCMSRVTESGISIVEVDSAKGHIHHD